MTFIIRVPKADFRDKIVTNTLSPPNAGFRALHPSKLLGNSAPIQATNRLCGREYLASNCVNQGMESTYLSAYHSLGTLKWKPFALTSRPNSPSMRTTLLAILMAFPTFLIAQNIVQNPGFETAVTGVPTGDPLPTYPMDLDNWSAVVVDGELVNDPALAYDGNGFMSMLQNTAANDGAYWENGAGGGSGYDKGGQVLTVTPNTEYSFSFYYIGGDGSRYGYVGDSLVFHIEEISPTFTGLFKKVIDATDIVNWQFYETTLTTGASTTEIFILFSAKGSGNVDIWVDNVDVHVNNPTAVTEQEAAYFDVWPTQTSSFINVRTERIAQIQIRAINGQLIREIRSVETGRIDVGDLTSGVYLISALSDGQVVTKKFVKI